MTSSLPFNGFNWHLCSTELMVLQYSASKIRRVFWGEIGLTWHVSIYTSTRQEDFTTLTRMATWRIKGCMWKWLKAGKEVTVLWHWDTEGFSTAFGIYMMLTLRFSSHWPLLLLALGLCRVPVGVDVPPESEGQPCWMRMSTHSWLPARRAKNSGVWPRASRLFTSTPYCTKDTHGIRGTGK